MEQKTLFGQRLRQLREETGLSQIDLAKSLNTVKQNISRYELDQTEPQYWLLIKIAELFHVSLDYLLGRTDTK